MKGMGAVALAAFGAAALGVALCPLVPIEMILIIFSARRTVNALVFVPSLMLLSAGVLAIASLTGEAVQSTGSSIGPGVSVALALMLIAGGVRNLRQRHHMTPPKILESISGMGGTGDGYPDTWSDRFEPEIPPTASECQSGFAQYGADIGGLNLGAPPDAMSIRSSEGSFILRLDAARSCSRACSLVPPGIRVVGRRSWAPPVVWPITGRVDHPNTR